MHIFHCFGSSGITSKRDTHTHIRIENRTEPSKTVCTTTTTQQTVNEADVNRIRRAASEEKRNSRGKKIDYVYIYKRKKRQQQSAEKEEEERKNHATHSTFDEKRNGNSE